MRFLKSCVLFLACAGCLSNLSSGIGEDVEIAPQHQRWGSIRFDGTLHLEVNTGFHVMGAEFKLYHRIEKSFLGRGYESSFYTPLLESSMLFVGSRQARLIDLDGTVYHFKKSPKNGRYECKVGQGASLWLVRKGANVSVYNGSRKIREFTEGRLSSYQGYKGSWVDIERDDPFETRFVVFEDGLQPNVVLQISENREYRGFDCIEFSGGILRFDYENGLLTGVVVERSGRTRNEVKFEYEDRLISSLYSGDMERQFAWVYGSYGYTGVGCEHHWIVDYPTLKSDGVHEYGFEVNKRYFELTKRFKAKEDKLRFVFSSGRVFMADGLLSWAEIEPGSIRNLETN